MGVCPGGSAVSCVRQDEWLWDTMMNNETKSDHTLRTLECDPHSIDEVSLTRTPPHHRALQIHGRRAEPTSRAAPLYDSGVGGESRDGREC
jgi:hypothetical protein